MARDVEVKFPMSEDVWNKVIVEAQVDHYDVDERGDHFIVIYNSKQDFESEVVRWEGLIELEVMGGG